MHLIARVLVFNIKDKDHGSHSQTMGQSSDGSQGHGSLSVTNRLLWNTCYHD